MAVLVTAQFFLSDADLVQGWEGKLDELQGSVVARLDEVIGDDGGAYVPQDVVVHVKQLRGAV